MRHPLNAIKEVCTQTCCNIPTDEGRNVPKTQRDERNEVQAASAIVLAACSLKTRSRHSGSLSDGTKPTGRSWDVLILKTTQNAPCENTEVCIACKAPLIESMFKQACVMESQTKHQVQPEVKLAFILKDKRK